MINKDVQKILISESELDAIVERLAGEIDRDYAGEDKKLVIITFEMRQYPAFTQIVSSIDKNAFVTVHRAHEINGEGWTYGISKNDGTDSE